MQGCYHLAWVLLLCRWVLKHIDMANCCASRQKLYPFQVLDMWHNKIITGLHTLCDMDPTCTLHERRPVINAKVTFIYYIGQGWCSLDNAFVHGLEHIAVSKFFSSSLVNVLTSVSQLQRLKHSTPCKIIYRTLFFIYISICWDFMNRYCCWLHMFCFILMLLVFKYLSEDFR